MELYVPNIQPRLPQATIELTELAKTHNIPEIAKISGYTEEGVRHFLSKNYIGIFRDPNALRVLEEYYNNIKINDKRIMVIADTHIGNDKYIPRLLEDTYNFALNNNIKTIIHLGDIIDGDCNYFPNLDLSLQFKILKKYYPECEDINTYYILGNHDYTFHGKNVDKYSEYKEILNSIKGLIHLSDLRTIATLNDHRTLLYHCDAYPKCLPDLELDLSLYGHIHEYRFDSEERKIVVPPLNLRNLSYSGFIILNYNNDGYYIEHYGFDNNYCPVTKDIKTLTYKQRI